MTAPAELAAIERQILVTGCATINLDPVDAELISLGDSAIFRLSGQLVARVTRDRDQRTIALKEVAVARWLADVGIPAVRVATDPVHVGERVITIWHELPAFRPATPLEIASFLTTLHHVEPPSEFTLPQLRPFSRIAERIHTAPLTQADKQFLINQLDQLHAAWPTTSFKLDTAIIHGDPHADNVVTTGNGTTLILDLERFSLGPPEWDLALMASEHHSFRWITTDQYRTFIKIYGYDVTTAPAYPLLRDIRELRMTTWLANKANQNPKFADETHHRIACLRGLHGPRPWPWQPY